MKLYELSEMYEKAMLQIEEIAEKNDGVIPDDWSDFLDAINEEHDKKCLTLARWIKNLEAESDAIKAEEKKLYIRRESVNKRIESIKNYLIYNCKKGEIIKDSNTVIGWRKSSIVEIDESKLPSEYWKIEKIPMKKEIKEAIKSGLEILGASMKEKLNIQIK